jgi:hypothetical protein
MLASFSLLGLFLDSGSAMLSTWRSSHAMAPEHLKVVLHYALEVSTGIDGSSNGSAAKGFDARAVLKAH